MEMNPIKSRNFYIDSISNLISDIDRLLSSFNEESCTKEHLDILNKEKEVAIQLINLDRARWNTTPRLGKNNYPVFEVLLVDHCNYNCAYCNHWSNIAPKHFYDYDQLMKDLERISFLYERDCSVKLMGGEPTIHPRLKDILENTPKLFKSPVQILTNGLVLISNIKKKDFSLFEIFKKYNITVEITAYPYINYDELIEVLKKYNIFTRYSVQYGQKDSIRHDMQVHGVNIDGVADWKNRHLCCGNSNTTINLKEGKIFACPFKACLNIFIKYFGLEDKMQVTNEDYIDIYEAKSKEEIAKFLCTGTPACKYCTGDTINFSPESHPWRKTTKSITEWIDAKGLEKSLHTEDFNILNK